MAKINNLVKLLSWVGPALDTLGGRGRGVAGRIASLCTCRMRKAGVMPGDKSLLERGLGGGGESQPWYPLAMDDTGRMFTRPR